MTLPREATRSRDAAIIFLHIPKTAGSTVRRVLARQFHPSQVFTDRAGQGDWDVVRKLRDGDSVRGKPDLGERLLRAGEARGSRDRNRRYAEMLRDVPGVENLGLLQGHFWFGIHEVLPRPATYVTLLRDPLERVLSLYHHRATRQGVELGLEEYIRDGRDFEVDNGQVRRLCGVTDRDIRYAEVDRSILDLAKRNLVEHFGVVGVTERFDEFLAMLGREFSWSDLRYIPRNISGGRPRRDGVSPDVLAELESLNRYDAELHRFAERLVGERVDDSLAEEARRLRANTAAGRRIAPVAGPLWRRARRASARTRNLLRRRGAGRA